MKKLYYWSPTDLTFKRIGITHFFTVGAILCMLMIYAFLFGVLIQSYYTQDTYENTIVIYAEEDKEMIPKLLSDMHKANVYLGRPTKDSQDSLFKGTPLTGHILISCAYKIYKETGVYLDIKFILAQGQLESSLGTSGKSPVNNPFNIGEHDDRTTMSFKSTEEGVIAYYRILVNE